MIEIRNIKKSFGSLEVLKGIDLTIEKGEVVSIVGRSYSLQCPIVRRRG